MAKIWKQTLPQCFGKFFFNERQDERAKSKEQKVISQIGHDADAFRVNGVLVGPLFEEVLRNLFRVDDNGVLSQKSRIDSAT